MIELPTITSRLVSQLCAGGGAPAGEMGKRAFGFFLEGGARVVAANESSVNNPPRSFRMSGEICRVLVVAQQCSGFSQAN